MRSVELFAGCGGLALGLADAGFRHVVVIEKDPQAIATLTANKKRGVRHLIDWRISSSDVREIDYSRIKGVDLVAGGPPCQPFSIGGRHKGPNDARNMWPEAIRAVRELRPKAFIFENVRGLLRPNFNEYLEFLQLQLSWPEIGSCNRSWHDQRKLLSLRRNNGVRASYSVVVQGINTADYGAPQRRHRAIILGVRSDISEVTSFPSSTHSRDALVWDQRWTEDYWTRHELPRRAWPALSDRDRFILERLEDSAMRPRGRPWRTVRDAISDLPSPTVTRAKVPNHTLHPGARVYARHTGSTLDEPAKALKAGDHGVPGGENILVGRRGAVRYFTLREMARLQGLPDDFILEGGWKGPVKQLGNAVPVQVGRAFGIAIRKLIEA